MVCVLACAGVVDTQERGPGPVPHGWTALADATSRCIFAVPPRWRGDEPTEAGLLAVSPDGRTTAAISWSADATLTSRLASVLRPTVVHVNSFERLWLEYPSGPPGMHHVAAVPADGGHCLLYLDARDVDEAAKALAHAIVDTLAPLR